MIEPSTGQSSPPRSAVLIEPVVAVGPPPPPPPRARSRAPLRSGEHTAGIPAPTFFVFRPFFFNDTATTEIYTLSLHDALPIYADPVARDARVVRACGRAERIDDRAVDRPVESTEVRRADRAGCGGGPPRLRLTASAFQSLDPVVERALVLVEPGQSLLRLARAAPRLPQARLPFPFEGEIAVQLVGALVLAPRERFARVDEQLPLARDPVAQLVHVVGQQAVLAAHEVQVLVARQQIAEALSREQHLPAVERAALVDVDQAPLQHGALLQQRVLRDQQVHGDLIDLPAETGDLPVELVHDAVGALLLLLDVGDFIGQRVRLGSEPLQLLLDVGTLAADALEALLVLLHLLLVGGTGLCAENGKRETGNGKRKSDQSDDRAPRFPFPVSRVPRLHTRFRCLPTLVALPSNPMSAPNATIASASSCVKNEDWSR